MEYFLKKTIRIAPLFVMLLAIVEIVLSTQLAGSGVMVSLLDRRIDTLSAENELLAQEVASASSLLTITAKAEAMGLAVAKPEQALTLGPDTLRVAFGRPQ